MPAWRLSGLVVVAALLGASAAPNLLGVSAAPNVLGVSAAPNLLGVSAAPNVLGVSAAPNLVAEQGAAPQAAFSGQAAKQQVDVLASQIGSRPAGSAAYEQAVAYVSEQLRQWGYTPTLQTFPVDVFEDRGSQVVVSTGLQIPADTLQYSVAGQVEAPLVVAGLGQPSDLTGLDLQGKIALIKRGELRFSEKVANAAAAGAVGVIVYNDSPGRAQGSLTRPEEVPAVTISGDSGQQILQLLAAGPLTVRLAVDAATSHSSSTNVIAELPATQSVSAGSVVFSAHLDSVPAGPGANDNGSGSGVVLELARELSQRSEANRSLTLRFAFFGAEELGLFGSRYYVEHLSEAERHALLADINLDMVGVGDAWRFGGSDDLVQLALGAASDVGQRALPLRGPLLSASDHASFAAAGLPAVFLYRVEDPNYHTAGDVANQVDAEALTQAGTIALEVLDGLPAH